MKMNLEPGQIAVLATRRLPALLLAFAAMWALTVSKDLRAQETKESGELIRGLGATPFRVSQAGLLMSGRSGGAIPTAVTTSFAPTGNDSYQVLIATELDSHRLETLPDTSQIELEVFAYALDSESSVAGRGSQRVRLDTPATRDEAESAPIKIVLSIRLPAGVYRVRTLVEQSGTDRFGLAGANLDLPQVGGDSPLLSSPWLVSSAQGWKIVTPAEGFEAGTNSLYSFDSEARLRVLSALPLVPEQGSVTGVALVSGAASSYEPDLVAVLLRADGQPLVESPVTVVSRSETRRTGTMRLVFELQPPDLPPGTYGLSLQSTAGARSDTPPQASARFRLVEPERLRSLVAWTDIDIPAPSPDLYELRRTQRSSDPKQLDQFVVVTDEEIRARFVDVVEELAQGHRLAARAWLREFEVEALRSRSPAAIVDLQDKELRVLSSLAGESTFRLLPIAVVYAELIGDYHRRGLAPLSEHALQMSIEMTDPLTRRSHGGLEDAVAADVLVSIASYAILARRTGVGEQLLEAALRVEPQHRAALMSLAASREQHGRYSEAAEALRALVRSHPQDREARLRWAVNLERLNQRSKAEELYSELALAGVGDWIELVAIDQLAAMLAARGDLDQAEATLRSAIERWPNQPTLRIQLAWVLDEAHQLQSASELVERLVSSSASTRQSPRYRYNHWHIHIFDESRLTLSKLIREYADGADTEWLMREGGEE